MKTQIIFFFSFLLVFSLNAQVTHFGVSSGTLGDGSSFFGYAAGKNNTATGKDNTFVGHLAGLKNTIGINGTFIGSDAGTSHVSGSNNTFVGRRSGFSSVNSNNNTCVGAESGYNMSGGKYNVFVGGKAGWANSGGAGNTAFGYGAGQKLLASSFNTFIGYGAGTSMTAGVDNTLLGREAGGKKETGSENVMIGSGAGLGNTAGMGNVFIGNEAGASETGSWRLYIDNSSTSDPLIYGNFRSNQLGVNTGTIPLGYTLAVDGKIIAEEVRVQLVANWPDYVFDPSYDLMPIQDLKKYIEENKHLPEVPSARQIQEEGGQDVGEMNRLLLKKVEELSLYVIQLQEEIELLKKK